VRGKQEPVAMIIPLEDMNTPGKKSILDGIASFKERGDGKIFLEVPGVFRRE
jgi:hypothetical protein